jgi:xylulose-5-phosphate/fructose-6-phosphate phosphoketolase
VPSPAAEALAQCTPLYLQAVFAQAVLVLRGAYRYTGDTIHRATHQTAPCPRLEYLLSSPSPSSDLIQRKVLHNMRKNLLFAKTHLAKKVNHYYNKPIMHGLGIDIDKLAKRVRAADYLSVTQIYLQSNFLVKAPLKPDDIKPRLLGHWGTCHGINLAYANLKAFLGKDGKTDNFEFVLGPGHGFPALQANLFLDGDLLAIDPRTTLDEAGIAYISKEFSWPHGFPSHSSPVTPGIITEGGELGYSLGAAYGAALASDNPDKTIAVLIGDGEMETASLLASLNLNKIIKTTAKVLPILHLNGYKISAPSIYARISDRELKALLRGFGYEPIHINGENAEAFQLALEEAEKFENPFIIMETDKGATGPEYLNGEKIAGNYLSHQVPLPLAKTNDAELEDLEHWLRSYRFDEIFPNLQEVSYGITNKITEENPYTTLFERFTQSAAKSKPNTTDFGADLPAFVVSPGQEKTNSARKLGELLRDEMAKNPNFRFFSPDETTSNRLDAIFEATDRAWQRELKPWDKYLSPDGRVIEMLSENTLFSVMSSYILSGKPAMITSYEAFLPIIVSQLDQYLKFLIQSREVKWRKKVPALNILSTSVCWRQDHNGFSHQNPAFIDHLLNKPSDFANCLFPVDDIAAAAAFEFMTKTKNVVNLTTFDKNNNPRWIDFNHARFQFTNGGASIFQFASDDNPDIILTAAGDIVTREMLYARNLVKRDIPHLKLRFVGINALHSSIGITKIGTTENPLLPETFYKYFTQNQPIVAAFHGHPETFRHILNGYDTVIGLETNPRKNRIDVHGFEDRGSTTTPFSMLMWNMCSRYNLAMSIVGSAWLSGIIDKTYYEVLIDKYNKEIFACEEYAKKYGTDQQDVSEEWL